MRLGALYAAARRRPFVPFEITLDTGEKYRVNHPETIIVNPVTIMMEDAERHPLLLAPESIRSIRFLRRNGGQR